MLAVAKKHLAPTRRAVAAHVATRPASVRCVQSRLAGRVQAAASSSEKRHFATTVTRRYAGPSGVPRRADEGEGEVLAAEELNSVGGYEREHEHAVISAFDLFSIGGASPLIRAAGLGAHRAAAGLMRLVVGPSSSHTVGPMRAGKIFIGDLENLGLLDQVCTVYYLACLDSKTRGQVKAVKITL